jgi:hypothetical protein
LAIPVAPATLHYAQPKKKLKAGEYSFDHPASGLEVFHAQSFAPELF